MSKERINILLVDDTRGDQVLFQEALREAGINFEMSILERADHIVEFVEERKPQLIFMDVIMLGVSGEEAVKLLKNNINTKDIPIILVSVIFGVGNDLEHHKEVSIDGKNYSVLAKPIDIVRLREIVNKYI